MITFPIDTPYLMFPSVKKRTFREAVGELAELAAYGSPAGRAYKSLRTLRNSTATRSTNPPSSMPPYRNRRRRYSKRRATIRRARSKAAYRFKRRVKRKMRGTAPAMNRGKLMNTLACPFPKTKKASLVWNFYHAIDHTNQGSGMYGFRIFNCGNPQHPLSSVAPTVTGQARWGDTLATLYEKYMCYGSKITLRIRNPTTTTTNSNGLLMALFMFPTDMQGDALPATTPYNEMKMSPYRVTPFKLVNVGENPVTLTASWSLKRTKHFNTIQGSGTNAGNYYVTWDPANATALNNVAPRMWQYALVVYNQDPADTTGTTNYIAEERVEYFTKWITRRANNTSAVTPNAMDND